ncbi:MAG: saccharopine dehydrogenase NADP-binding domain-containing protein, partial [Thermoplasmata archaeon]|nr:saccharopine dehydrogenase NADP-binding domain-containing protein [Thermoplasmata archaeon]
MSYRYAVIGAGRMGLAAAYDLAKFGDPQEVLILDIDLGLARETVERFNNLVNNKVASAAQVDINNSDHLETILEGVDSIISAVPYSYNPALTELALKVGAHMCDLGGHTGIVRQQLKKDS